MVVEDEPDIYDVLLAMFEIWGIEGVAFVDGAEAVAWIENVDQGRVRGELPELAILDIRLPEISGPEVGQRLRASSILGDMAIVLITAYRLSPEEEDAVVAQAKADLLMYKPLPAMLELRQKMDDVVAQHRKEPEPEPEKVEAGTTERKQAASQVLKESQDAETEPVQTPSTRAESSEVPKKPASQDGK
jgi:DNA-binding response OmpR family regulator